MNTKQRLAVGGLVLLAVVAVLIFFMMPGPLVVGSLGDCEVRAQATSRRGAARFQSDGKVATVQLGDQTARLAGDVIELAGGRQVNIPANCKKIGLLERRGGMHVFFDGKETN